MWWCSFAFIFILYKLPFILTESFPLLLLVSFGGFRFDYPNLYGPLENFSRLKQNGVYTHSMTPSFTTATFPNHYTLITGLYEEVHGIISDEIYDPKTNSVFQSWNNTGSQWWPLRAIWAVNEFRTGARSGVIGWPQDSIVLPKYEKYRTDRSSRDIINQILNWFKDPDQPINFGAIYLPEPGLTGRQTGPYSAQTKDAVKQCDADLGYLLDEINKVPMLKENLHLIVTSDHGMEEIMPTNTPMYLEDYVDMTKLKAFGTETVLNIFVNSSDDINDIFQNLSQIPHSQVYRREDIPDRYHYKTNPRIGDLIIFVKPGYELHRRSFRGSNRVALNTKHGNSGYDNEIDSMKTIFYASGPQLKTNFTLSNSTTLYTVDIFALMCLILKIDKCPSSNGSLANIQAFLTEPDRVLHIMEKEVEKLHDGPMGLVVYLLVLVGFVLILIMAVAWTAVAFRNSSNMARGAHLDATTIAEQNQYKFTQINDLKRNPAIGDEHL